MTDLDSNSNEKLFTRLQLMKIFGVTSMTIYNWATSGYIEKIISPSGKVFFTLPKIVRNTLKNENEDVINRTIIEIFESEKLYSSREMIDSFDKVQKQTLIDWRKKGKIEFVECPKYLFWHRVPEKLQKQ